MEKEKNKSERLDKSYLIKTISVIERLHDDLMVLQEAYMKEQQSLFHEKWKVRYLTRILKHDDISISHEINPADISYTPLAIKLCCYAFELEF